MQTPFYPGNLSFSGMLDKYVMRKIESANTDNIHVNVVSFTSSNYLTCLIRPLFVFTYHMKDCEDHAVLLCSLLQGFGLNAYVCVGTKAKGAAHTWVMTISPEGEVTFWESLTAHRCVDIS